MLILLDGGSMTLLLPLFKKKNKKTTDEVKGVAAGSRRLTVQPRKPLVSFVSGGVDSSLLARPRPCSSSHAAGPARFRARNQNGSRAPSWPSFRLRAGRAVAGADLVVTPLRAAPLPRHGAR